MTKECSWGHQQLIIVIHLAQAWLSVIWFLRQFGNHNWYSCQKIDGGCRRALLQVSRLKPDEQINIVALLTEYYWDVSISSQVLISDLVESRCLPPMQCFKQNTHHRSCWQICLLETNTFVGNPCTYLHQFEYLLKVYWLMRWPDPLMAYLLILRCFQPKCFCHFVGTIPRKLMFHLPILWD